MAPSWGGPVSKDKVYIVGVGAEGASSLSPEVREFILKAEILIGGQRLLEMFPAASAKRVVIRNNLPEAVEVIRANLGKRQMVVLASGDPDFYGIARRLIRDLDKSIFEIIPNVSSMQLAFARIKESWDDAVFTSVHARSIQEIIEMVRVSRKVGILTDEEHTPAVIARILVEHGLDGYQAYVCEDLGQESERIVTTDLPSLRGMRFSRLNILILLKASPDEPKALTFGIPDEKFYRRGSQKGLITKLEVRAVSLMKMRLKENSVLWDVGAGSGAVSIEAAFLAGKGRIYAIEKNTEDVAVISENIKEFAVHNVQVVQTSAPDNLGKLPSPDAVFIGGSGGRLAEILDVACSRVNPGGRIVVNAVTLENLNTAIESLGKSGFSVETTLINVSRSKDIANLTRLEPLTPVFVITGTRRVALE
jgi:precorrin-6Y C5,15-methyltransferase (decarboxylating)